MRSSKPNKARNNIADELPAELDRGKLRFLGFGLKALDHHSAGKRGRTIELAPDVAKLFRNEVEVNEALRLVQKMRELGKPRKKTA